MFSPSSITQERKSRTGFRTPVFLYCVLPWLAEAREESTIEKVEPEAIIQDIRQLQINPGKRQLPRDGLEFDASARVFS